MRKITALALVFLCTISLISCDLFKDNTQIGSTYIVIEVTESNLLVADIGEDGEAIESSQYSVPNWFYPSTQIEIGYKITISHSDEILEAFPMQFSEIYKMEYYDEKTGLGTVMIAD